MEAGMDRQPLYAKGHYFVTPVEQDGLLDDVRTDGFAVISATGDPLHYETTFEAAHEWVECRLFDDRGLPVPDGRKTRLGRRQ